MQLVSWLVLAAVPVACETSGAPLGAPCTRNSDCSSGQCVPNEYCDSVCVCGKNTDCAPGEHCESTTCGGKCFPGLAPVGSFCGSNSECLSGSCVGPDASCYEYAQCLCTKDADCGPAEKCVPTATCGAACVSADAGAD